MCLKDLRDEFLYYVTVRHRDALQWDDPDGAEDIKPDYILVKHGKGSKERVVPKSPALSKQLMKYRTLRDAYLKEYPSRHKNLFLSKNGKPLTDEAVARMLKH